IAGSDLDATFFSNQKCIDGVDPGADVAQQSGEERPRYGRCVQLDKLARKFDLHFAYSTVNELCLKAAELFRQINIRPQESQLFRSQRRNIYRAAQGAAQKIIAHLFCDCERDAFLSLRGRGAEVWSYDNFIEH